MSLQDIKWYVAEIIIHITVEGDSRSVVHNNMILVRATSDEEAYEQAVKLGKEAEQSYLNIDGKRVDSHFRGLHDLNLIHDNLEHGTEIIYSEEIGKDEVEIKSLLTPKEKLGIFAPRKPNAGPNYSSGEVQMILKAMKNEK